ncbi:hypothetical protein FPOAC1_007068 [Fusarium poae]|uniref:hypothetical protein n=1 Tax=Fusarium poae TaxID=36050 RepID=UPI001CEA3D88|nr:hypothetical protein FPOAC1_007068 [Fusarium poae]KAG8673750.1 hypothetical protein FPOAC1_007068 [Fusarium poae]
MTRYKRLVIDILDATLDIHSYQTIVSTWSTVSSRNYAMGKSSVKRNWTRNYHWPRQRLHATCLWGGSDQRWMLGVRVRIVLRLKSIWKR